MSRILHSVSFRLTSGLIGLFLAIGLVAGGAIIRLHMINTSVDSLIARDFEPLFEAENLVQRVQILVALTPKLLNARDEFELGNLSSQITDMFNVLDRSHARIPGDVVSGAYNREIARHRTLLRAALDQLIARLRSQLQLNAAMSRARHDLATLLTPVAAEKPGTTAAPRMAALAVLLYQTSLAGDAPEIERARLAASALLAQTPNDSSVPPAASHLVNGASSIFVIRQNQLDLARTLQGEAGETNLRANQLVYAVANLSAAMHQVAEAARIQRHAEVARTTANLTALFILSALIACGLVIYVRRGVLRRLVALRDSASTGTACAAVLFADDGTDEIGDLARALRFYVGEIKAKSEELRLLAATDPLTGLPNRREFMARGEAEILRQRPFGNATCVLMLDIDHFKRVNDSWGHPAGDRVIREVAAIGQEIFRGQDVIGRIGGEEYAVLLAATAQAGAMAAAQRMRAAVEGMSVVIEGGQRLKVTVSLGLAQIRDQETLSALMGRADQALYEAKRSGRNQVCAAPCNGLPAAAKRNVLF